MKILWNDAGRATSVYQTREYGLAVSLSPGTSWDVLGDDVGRWRLPLCLSTIADSEFIDATSPYGYAGIQGSLDLTQDEAAEAWSQTLRLLQERDVVSVFLRFAPYRDGVEMRCALPGLDVVEVSETVVIPLLDDAAMWSAMSGRSRTAVRKAAKEQLRASVLPATAELLTGTDSDFRRVYDVAMDRVGASPSHRHSDEYYRLLTECSNVQLVEVRDVNGSVVAASLLLVDMEAVHYHLSGSLLHAGRQGANNLLIWIAMQWASANGHRQLHLGGGTSRDDSLFRFKASFGGRIAPFHVGRLIVNPVAYDQLVAKRAAAINVHPKILAESSFFPAYRAVVG